MFFVGFSGHKIATQEEHSKMILYTILPVRSVSINYNKTHKSRLKYEIKYDMYKIAQKIIKNINL